ncbi:MAG: DUF1572 domain-containing protein [Sphingobacteriales bacterium]|nr:MAG: DUF1572 domain-containing protein [Sphingobacteriales bacterium]
MDNYLEDVKQQFKYYKMLGDKTISQLPDDKLFWQPNPTINSIAIIIQHLSGNMLSRFTNFLTTDGEKDWRNRDEEFIAFITLKPNLLLLWEQGWACLFNALNTLESADLSKTIYIRNMGQTVTQAINRQLAHYPYHIGQMVFIGKMVCANAWLPLSIPIGKSKEFNSNKFNKPKHNQHFTNEFLNPKK